MLTSYFTIALKHLTGQKLYSAINIAGLAVGLACFLLIALFVRHELSYDRHFANADRIYRVSRDFFGPRAAETYLATMAGPVSALLEQDFPQIEKAARISIAPAGVAVSDSDGNIYSEQGVAEADSTLFKIFDFEWLRGDPATALESPSAIVLTRNTASKYFGDTDPIGRTLTLENVPRGVTGVIEDPGDNTHFHFTMLTRLDENRDARNWSFNRYYTYILLEEGADARSIQDQSGEFFDRHFENGSSAYTGFTLTAVTDIHLRSHREAEMKPPGSVVTVYTFSAIAVMVLLIACINFVNLATARSTKRAKEIGVRKAIGAGRRQIVVQFLAESVVLAFAATLLAVTLVELALPAFNGFLGQDLAFEYLGDAGVAAALLLLAIAIGFAAGAYPALYLSAFDPTRVLKGDLTRGRGAAAFRRGLVVSQFAISIALLIGTAVVFQQMRFARDLELGYEKDRIVVVRGSLTQRFGEQWQALKQEWLAHPDVTHVTASNLTPAMQNPNAVGLRGEDGDPDGRGVPFLWVDYDFFETYGIDVLTGRTFSEAFGTDRLVVESRASGPDGAYVINELAARQFDWTADEAIGKWLEFLPEGQFRGPVVGVVQNVHFESVHNAIEPTVYVIPPDVDLGYNPLASVSLRISGRNLADTLGHIERTWSALMPDQPLWHRFLDQDFETLYQAEQRQAQMFTAFSALAIFIACLGLLGLASFAAEQRTKEIGVRKVMGGTVLDIVRLFTGEFSRLVIAANVVAWPVAWFLMQRWLENFAYRVDMNVLAFVGSALLALVVAVATVGTIAARAALANPIRSLRYE